MAFGSSVNAGHVDANQQFSITGVIGSAGTNDVGGTALTLPIGVREDTGAMYVYNLGPAGSVTVGNTPGGTLNRIGSIDTIGTLPAISVSSGSMQNIVTGTMQTLGTVGSIVGLGTLTNIGSIDVIGTMPAISVTANPTSGTLNTLGTVGSIANVGTLPAINIATGTLNVGSVAVTSLPSGGTLLNLATGTLASLGTLPGVGTISNLGSISNIGTLPVVSLASSGTILNIASGTLASLGTLPGIGTISNLGSISNIGTLPVVSLASSGTILNLAAGTLNTLGTLGTIGNVGTINTDLSINAVVNGTNSTTATLAANGTFTGGTVDLLPYSTIRLTVFSDQASATNGLNVRFSNDGTNWDVIRQTTVPASAGVYAAFNRIARYLSVQYINGAGSQTAFRLQTVLAPNSPEFTRRFLSEIPTPYNAGIITQSVIVGSSTAAGGTFVAVKVAPSGAVQIGGVIDGLSTGTINVGSVAVTSMPSGGTILNLATGTLASVGTIPGVGTITNLGSVSNIGTLPVISLASSGTILNLATGTLASVGTIPGIGTITNLGSVTNIGTLPVVSLASSGTILNLAAGTLTVIPNVPGGTIGVVSSVSAIAAGTLNTLGTVGVLNNGTVSINNKMVGSAILTTETHGTTGAAVFGTLVAPVGAGTYVYLCGLSVVVTSGTVDCGITNNVAGSSGAGVYTRGNFPAGGGIMRDFTQPIATGTNGTICYFMNGAGTVDFAVNYWVGT